MDNQQPFVFHTERRLVMLTGRSARNLAELLEHIRQVSGSSIFYHTHHQYLSHRRSNFFSVNSFLLCDGATVFHSQVKLFSFPFFADFHQNCAD